VSHGVHVYQQPVVGDTLGIEECLFDYLGLLPILLGQFDADFGLRGGQRVQGQAPDALRYGFEKGRSEFLYNGFEESGSMRAGVCRAEGTTAADCVDMLSSCSLSRASLAVLNPA